MNRALLCAIASMSLGLTACETPTVYAPAASAEASGYSEMAIEQGRWRESYLETNDADYSDWLIEVQLELDGR